MTSLEDEAYSKNLDSSIPFQERCSGHHIISYRNKLSDNRCENCTPDEENKNCEFYRPVSQPNIKETYVTE